jgi:predicted DCC family thiol-disulfide oxidoreductase YuxK
MTQSQTEQNGTSPVVIYDGECGLCDWSVQWLLKHDRKRIFRFTPLQSDWARTKLGPLEGDPSGWTIMLQDERGLHERSTAVFRILSRIGGIYSLVKILYVIPRPIRDAVYRWVARNRYRWFGKRDECRIPSAAERELFLS